MEAEAEAGSGSGESCTFWVEAAAAAEVKVKAFKICRVEAEAMVNYCLLTFSQTLVLSKYFT